MASSYPKSVIVRRILVTDLSQQLKKERDFLRWMVRRHQEQPAVAAAFEKSVQIVGRLRDELLAGDFDAVLEEDLFTPGVAGDHELIQLLIQPDYDEEVPNNELDDITGYLD